MKYTVLILFFILLNTPLSYAHAEYVLPYPSFMPGNKAHKISRVVDALKKYWNFGSIAQTKYHMSLSDKYLVEAKTLFEYKQYVLALAALDLSDKHALFLTDDIKRGIFEKKNMSAVGALIDDEMKVHAQVLEKIKTETPIEFTWTPEKVALSILRIHEKLDDSIRIRKQIHFARAY